MLPLTTIVTIFGLISTAFTIVKEAPEVIEVIESLIAKVQPHVIALGLPPITAMLEDFKTRLAAIAP